MRSPLPACLAFVALVPVPLLAAPEIPLVSAAMQRTVDAHQIAGAVTLVATRDQFVHLSAVGYADVPGQRPMPEDALFWIASMTKPITSTAILMLQDEGRLKVDDPVAKYLPDFERLRTPSGQPAHLTIAQLLHHTSGLADPRAPETRGAKTLPELVRIYLSRPMQFEPGSTWRYTSSGFDVAGLIVEAVSGQSFESFLQSRLFGPLGMTDTTFYPNEEQRGRLARGYRADPATGELAVQTGLGPNGPIPTQGDAPPKGGGGLFSTASDYARFCQMLLNRGTLGGRRYLSEDSVRALTTVGTGNLPTGYTKTKLNHILGWGLGVAIVQEPDGGVSAELSPGSFGHPGAWGTAAWIDPVRGAAYVMMVQRSNMPDNMENPPALAFVHAAVAALADPVAAASIPLPPRMAPRPPPPRRLPTEPGTPPLTPVGGAPGTNPPADREGNFIIGPEYLPAPELKPVPGVPRGTVTRFTMRSADSRIYPGISYVPPGGPPGYRPALLADIRRYPRTYTRTVTVYVPAGYVPGTPAPVIVTQDGPDNSLPGLLDNLIAQHRVPAMAAIMIQNGGADGQGSERGLEYDAVSGRYAAFVESEVIPLVEARCHVSISRDPDARATMGGSSGGAAAFTMAWFHPEWYHRVITYSGTYVNQAWPADPATPHGAWEYHAHLIPETPPKPIRIWMEVGDRDNFTNHDGYHDWVAANNRMATVLQAKGYHLQYVFAQDAGHTDRRVRAQTITEALEWVWRGYRGPGAP
jgi:enterochelin esterase family protein